jgi:hypothetical protein
MDVKRYDATVEYGPGWDAGASAVMDEAADGDWVEFTDYAAVEAECDRLRTERDRLSEQVRDLEESWIAFAVMTHGHCPGPIYYRKFDGGLSRPYGWTHSHWAEKVGYHATPREAVMAAWRYGWEEENRAAILAEPHVDRCYSGRKADGK